MSRWDCRGLTLDDPAGLARLMMRHDDRMVAGVALQARTVACDDRCLNREWALIDLAGGQTLCEVPDALVEHLIETGWLRDGSDEGDEDALLILTPRAREVLRRAQPPNQEAAHAA